MSHALLITQKTLGLRMKKKSRKNRIRWLSGSSQINKLNSNLEKTRRKTILIIIRPKNLKKTQTLARMNK